MKLVMTKTREDFFPDCWGIDILSDRIMTVISVTAEELYERQLKTVPLNGSDLHWK